MKKHYAVVSEPFKGKWKKPQDEKSLQKRKMHNKAKKPTILNGHLVKSDGI